MDYDKRTLGEHGKKQSQTNPNKAKFKKAEMNVTSILTVGYENKPPIRAPKKQSQISKRQKPIQTSLPQRIMKNTMLSASEKTNPKQSQFHSAYLLMERTKSRFLNFNFKINLTVSQYSLKYWVFDSR